jgi:hypothetical protein
LWPPVILLPPQVETICRGERQLRPQRWVAQVVVPIPTYQCRLDRERVRVSARHSAGGQLHRADQDRLERLHRQHQAQLQQADRSLLLQHHKSKGRKAATSCHRPHRVLRVRYKACSVFPLNSSRERVSRGMAYGELPQEARLLDSLWAVASQVAHRLQWNNNRWKRAVMALAGIDLLQVSHHLLGRQ